MRPAPMAIALWTTYGLAVGLILLVLAKRMVDYAREQERRKRVRGES